MMTWVEDQNFCVISFGTPAGLFHAVLSNQQCCLQCCSAWLLVEKKRESQDHGPFNSVSRMLLACPLSPSLGSCAMLCLSHFDPCSGEECLTCPMCTMEHHQSSSFLMNLPITSLLLVVVQTEAHLTTMMDLLSTMTITSMKVKQSC